MRPQGCSTDYVPLGAVLFPARLGDIKEADKGNEGRVPGRLWLYGVVMQTEPGLKLLHRDTSESWLFENVVFRVRQYLPRSHIHRYDRLTVDGHVIFLGALISVAKLFTIACTRELMFLLSASIIFRFILTKVLCTRVYNMIQLYILHF